MKRIITLMLSVIIIISVFSGCKAKEAEYPRGWIDDIDALSIKINRMNEYKVHNLLGEPVAKLLNYRSDVYLDSEEVGVFVFYNEEDGTVERLEREKSYTEQVVDVTAQKRCEVMSKLIGRTKDEICSRYGEFSSTSKDLTVCRYKDFDGVKVSIYFNQNNIAEKLAMKAKGEPQNESEEEIPSENNLDPIKLLDDITLLREQIIGMNYRDTLDLFGDPQGVMEEDDCQVYFDSNKNCVFFTFDNLRKVSSIEKVNIADIKGKDYYYLPDKELLTALMNDFIGKSKYEMLEEQGDIKYILTTPNAYGYNNMYGKKVDVYYDSHDVVEQVGINRRVTFEAADGDIESIREKMIGLKTVDMVNNFGVAKGWAMNEDCYVYLNSLGNGIVFYYNDNDVINKVEEICANDVKISGAKNNIEKLTLIMAKFMGKSETEIVKTYGKPDKPFSSTNPKIPALRGGWYNNFDGAKIRVYYNDEGVAEHIYIE